MMKGISNTDGIGLLTALKKTCIDLAYAVLSEFSCS